MIPRILASEFQFQSFRDQNILLKSLSLIRTPMSFSGNTVRMSLKNDKIKSLFRELFIGLFSMFSS